jgi:hypothetical protein
MLKKFYLPVIVFLIALITSLTAISQDAEKPEFNNKKVQINIGVADIFAKNYWWYSVYFTDEYGNLVLQYPFGEIFRQPNIVAGFKYQLGSGALRFGANLSYNSGSLEDDNPRETKNSYSYLGTKLNLGYEWHSTFGRVNVFYGVDGSFGYTNNEIRSEYMNYDYPSESTSTLKESAIGINPLVGVNFFITPALSIGTELKFTAEYTTGKLTSEFIDGAPQPPVYDRNEEQKSNGFRAYFGPLGFISLNIHL